MKKLFTAFFAIALLASTISLQAQDKPAPSPFSKVEQKVGTTDLMIEYSRPGVKGRTIMGELVPYGKRWRTGANAVTKVTTSKDMMVEGQTLPAGTYALMTTPGKDSWGVHFFTYVDGSGRSYPADAKPALTVTATPHSTGDVKVESFLIYVDMLRDDSATLKMAWDNVVVPVSLGVK